MKIEFWAKQSLKKEILENPSLPQQLGIEALALENFIPFEKFKRLNKRKYFVIPTASHKLHTFVTYKRLIWIQFDPFAHYKIINEVAHNSYNKIFPFGTPFAFLKRNKIFQCRPDHLILLLPCPLTTRQCCPHNISSILYKEYEPFRAWQPEYHKHPVHCYLSAQLTNVYFRILSLCMLSLLGLYETHFANILQIPNSNVSKPNHRRTQNALDSAPNTPNMTPHACPLISSHIFS